MCGCDGCCHDDIPGEVPMLSPQMIRVIEERCGKSIEEIRATPLAVLLKPMLEKKWKKTAEELNRTLEKMKGV